MIPFISIILHRKLFNPVVLFVGVLLIQYYFHFFLIGVEYNDLNEITKKSILYGLGSFSLGYFVIYIFSMFIKNLKFKHAFILRRDNKDTNEKLYYLALILGLISCFFHLYTGINNGLHGSYSSFLVNVRMMYIQDPRGFFVFPHITILCQSIFLWLILINYKVKMSVFWILIITILCALSKFERSAILSVLLALLVMMDQKYFNGVKLRYISIVVGAFTAIFFLVAFQFDNKRTFFDLILILTNYFSKNIDMYSQVIMSVSPDYNPIHIFGVYARYLGFEPPQVNLDTDGSFNTYGYMINVFSFAGLYGLIIFNFILGVFFSLLYECRYLYNGKVLLFYSFFSFTLFFSFFAFSFFWTNWLYYFISIFIIIPILEKYFNKAQCI